MNIHINGDTERLIQAALASGDFATAEEFIAALASKWQPRKKSDAQQQNAFEAFSRLEVIGCMKPDALDLATNPMHMEGFGR
jgi:hypothetical protein